MKKLFFPVILGLIALLLALSALPQAFQAQAQGSGLPLNIALNETATPAATYASGTPTPQYFPYSATPGAGVLWSDPTFAGDKFEHPRGFEFFCQITGDAVVTNTVNAILQVSPDRKTWWDYRNSSTSTCDLAAPGNLSKYITGTIEGVWVRVKYTQSSTPTLSPVYWLVLHGFNENGKWN